MRVKRGEKANDGEGVRVGMEGRGSNGKGRGRRYERGEGMEGEGKRFAGPMSTASYAPVTGYYE